MNPRFSLALVALALVAGAIALWSGDRQLPTEPSRAQPFSSQPAPAAANTDGYRGDYVLAISWHPTFCESKPWLAECRKEKSSDYAADNFTLHGLWPQDDEYCGVGQRIIAIDEANRWSDLPKTELSEGTWRALQRVMPGTRGQLDRHEWVLHGTCSGVSAETYFKRSIALMEEINASPVRDLMAANLGRNVSRNQLRSAFDSAFGEGAGRKVRVDCQSDDGRGLIYELRINLKGDATGSSSLRDLIHAARNASNGCASGIVDRVGQQ